MEQRLTHIAQHSPLFSHDGIHDSQTHLAAPAYFYEQLRRELALSARSNTSISAIKICFEKADLTTGDSKLGAGDILQFSCELLALTRSEDCIGRLGINECIMLVSAGEIAAMKLLIRLHACTTLSLNGSLKISLSMITSICGESGLDFLNRLDQAALSTL